MTDEFESDDALAPSDESRQGHRSSGSRSSKHSTSSVIVNPRKWNVPLTILGTAIGMAALGSWHAANILGEIRANRDTSADNTVRIDTVEQMQKQHDQRMYMLERNEAVDRTHQRQQAEALQRIQRAVERLADSHP